VTREVLDCTTHDPMIVPLEAEMAALVIRRVVDASIAPHAYQKQNSRQTLAEGLEEYYRANEGVVARPASLPPESMALFRSHDMCHVIFGLSTTIADETMADIRTLLSCDVGWKRYAHYLRTDAQTKALFKDLGVRRAVLATLRSLPRIARAFVEARRMRKKWPWIPPLSYLTRTLDDLRREHGIRII
jgi:hypothetical protein